MWRSLTAVLPEAPKVSRRHVTSQPLQLLIISALAEHTRCLSDTHIWTLIDAAHRVCHIDALAFAASSRSAGQMKRMKGSFFHLM